MSTTQADELVIPCYFQREKQERQQQQRTVRAKLREKRQVSARARRYYDEYELRMRARMLKRRTREEQVRVYTEICITILQWKKTSLKDLITETCIPECRQNPRMNTFTYFSKKGYFLFLIYTLPRFNFLVLLIHSAMVNNIVRQRFTSLEKKTKKK